MSPFQPLGEQARWRTVYDLLIKTEVGEVVSYDQMGQALGLDPEADRAIIRTSLHRAAQEYEQVDKRAVEAVINVGYRVVEPPEHLRLARRQQRSARRALSRGHSKVTNVDLSGMDPEMRRAFLIVGQAFQMQQDFNRRMDVRQRNLERAVDAVRGNQARSDDEIAELKERLARLEARQVS